MTASPGSAADTIAALPILLLVVGALALGSSVWCLFFDGTRTTTGLIFIVAACVSFAIAFAQLARRSKITQDKG